MVKEVDFRVTPFATKARLSALDGSLERMVSRMIFAVHDRCAIHCCPIFQRDVCSRSICILKTFKEHGIVIGILRYEIWQGIVIAELGGAGYIEHIAFFHHFALGRVFGDLAGFYPSEAAGDVRILPVEIL